MASNLRVLVSNLGDGNWSGDDSQLDWDVSIPSGDSTIYFPPGATKGVVPTPSEQLGSSIDLIGWGAKTNWLFQLNNISASGTAKEGDISIYGYRPTGIPELIKTVPKADIGVGETYTYGGVDGEEVYGPFVAFKFQIDVASVTRNPSVLCYVVGWNYGDLCDSQITIT